MRVISNLEELPHRCPRPVATIGNFDGVHCGHRRLMLDLVERARKTGGTPTLVTFHPHPLVVLTPNNAPRQIQTLPQKLKTVESLGIELVIIIPFTRNLAQTSARDFAIGVLWEKLELREIYVGPNFAFGHRREGSFSLLKSIGQEKGFLVGKIAQVQFRGSRVSSTAVRQAIVAGQVALVRRLLARPYALDGTVIHGNSLGTSISFPTANLSTANELIPCNGVYVTFLTLDGRRHRSVTNVGTRPTVTGKSGSTISIESHVLDFSRDIYGQNVTLEFLFRLRPEERFSGKETLVAQIGRDVEKTRRYFRWMESNKTALGIQDSAFGVLSSESH